MSRLIANLVARNEASRFLGPVLNKLKSFVDEIVFTDDCSDDDTPYIACDFGARVAVAPKPMFEENESALRTYAWNHLEAYAEENDWILAIDADELLYGVDRLPALLDQSEYDVLGIKFYHMWNESQFRVDKLWAPTIGSRLFRFKSGGEFRKSNLACGSEPTYVPELIRQGKMLWETGLAMKHLGYVLEQDKIMKYNRYMKLDAGAYHNRDHLESIIDDEVELISWDIEG